MVDYVLKNNEVASFRIVTYNAAGEEVAAPEGDVFSAVSSNPVSLEVAIGSMSNGDPAVVARPLVRTSTGLSFELSDAAGLTPATVTIDIVSGDETSDAVSLGVDLTNVETAPQSIPSPTGP